MTLETYIFYSSVVVAYTQVRDTTKEDDKKIHEILHANRQHLNSQQKDYLIM